MNRNLSSACCWMFSLGIWFTTGDDLVRAQGNPQVQPDRQHIQLQREALAADAKARRSGTADSPLTDSPQSQLALTLWELTVSDTPKQPEADSKSNLAWQLQNLPTEFGSLNEVRDFISRLKDAGRLQSWREVRLVAFDGQATHLKVGADRPQIAGTNHTSMGRTNSIVYRSVGTLIEVRPRIDTEKYIQVQLDYEASDLAKAEDVPLTESNDGNSKFANSIVTRQLKTAARLKDGGAAIVQTDSTSGSADKSVAGQTVLIILGGSIAQLAAK
jgi:Flp pilus assembly secretin CpaC